MNIRTFLVQCGLHGCNSINVEAQFMKIAIMMRAIDQDSGFRAYTEELVESMIKLNKNNFFLLIYRLPNILVDFLRIRM